MERIRNTSAQQWIIKSIRWLLGAGIIVRAVFFESPPSWAAMAFGLLIFATGFLKQRDCPGGGCSL